MAGGGSGSQTFASTLTDLMTSLAVIFILLLVVFLKQAHDQSKKAKEQVKTELTELVEQKSLQLKQDADDPLKLSVMVNESQLRFPVNSAALSAEGAAFVSGFFRNLASKVCEPKLREKIDSIVIEGHTDTSGEKTPEGVRRNIALSQKRSYSVLEQAVSSVQGENDLYECLLKMTSANGRGSRMPIYTDGVYNADLSRRVEIKIQVRSAEQQRFRALMDQAQAQVEAEAKISVPTPPSPAPMQIAAPVVPAQPEPANAAPAPAPKPAGPPKPLQQ